MRSERSPLPTSWRRDSCLLGSWADPGVVGELGLQQRHGPGAVLVLGALVLALHDDARGQVGDAHRRVGLVDVLAAGAAGAVGVDAQVAAVDFHLVDLVGSGSTATVQAEVWMRPWDSVSGTRCTRWAPDSNLSWPYTSLPSMRLMISL
jgi:hypothetical protein